MAEETVIVRAEGIWCLNCEFLEQPHDVMPTGCGSCGCKAEAHVPVKVIQS